jgi:DNA replication protein DnaC
VIYREMHTLLEEIVETSVDGTRKEHMELLATVPLLIIDDLGMHKLAPIAAVPETRLHQAQAEPMAPLDFISCLVCDELTRRSERLLEPRRKQAQFRGPQKTLDNFDFNFNKKMNRSLVFDLATATFVARHEDALFLGPPGTDKSQLAQAFRHAVIGQGYRRDAVVVTHD